MTAAGGFVGMYIQSKGRTKLGQREERILVSKGKNDVVSRGRTIRKEGNIDNIVE